MAAVDQAVAVAQAASASPPLIQDPLLLGLGWVAAIVVMAVSVGKPLKDYLRGEKREDKVDVVFDAKSSAEAVLYNHLSEQVKQYREIADQAFGERNELVRRVAALEAKAEALDDAKKTIENMKARLDEKDAQISLLLAQASEERRKFLDILQTKDTEIARRNARIDELEARQRELEIRLTKDEATLGVAHCPFHNHQLPLPEVTFYPVPEADLKGA